MAQWRMVNKKSNVSAISYYIDFGWIIGPTNLSLEVEVQWESLKNKKGDSQ